jgi:translation initiation factor 2 subunit 1
MNELCRFYERKYPLPGEVVVVKIKRLCDAGAYVSLLAYAGIEGMILTTEYSRRRIRSMTNFIKVGAQEYAKVLRVDEEKGYIDLSKRQVDTDEKAEAEQLYRQSIRVHQILYGVHRKHPKISLYDLYHKLVWDLHRKYGHAYLAFQLIARGESKLLNDYELDGDVVVDLLKVIQNQFATKVEKLQADLECTCFNYEGIEAIKDAFKVAQAQSTQQIIIKANVVAAPLYVLTTMTSDTTAGLKLLDQAIAMAKAVLVERGGTLDVKIPPRIMTQVDVEKQKQMLDKLDQASREVDGDSNDEED